MRLRRGKEIGMQNGLKSGRIIGRFHAVVRRRWNLGFGSAAVVKIRPAHSRWQGDQFLPKKADLQKTVNCSDYSIGIYKPMQAGGWFWSKSKARMCLKRPNGA
jgi:hypothetical protein